MGQWMAGGLLEQGQTRPGEVRFSSLSPQLFPTYGQKLTQAEMTPYCVAKQKKTQRSFVWPSRDLFAVKVISDKQFLRHYPLRVLVSFSLILNIFYCHDKCGTLRT